MTARVSLQDPEGAPARSTDALVISLAERLAALRVISGAEAFGSLTAGYAAAGRQAAASSDGGRLRAALSRGPVAARGQAIWNALGIDKLADTPPTPVLEQLRNDLALLLADDVEDALARASHRTGPRASVAAITDEPATFVDHLVGMWAFGRELVDWIEAVAAMGREPEGTVRTAPPGPTAPTGPLLR